MLLVGPHRGAKQSGVVHQPLSHRTPALHAHRFGWAAGTGSETPGIFHRRHPLARGSTPGEAAPRETQHPAVPSAGAAGAPGAGSCCRLKPQHPWSALPSGGSDGSRLSPPTTNYSANDLLLQPPPDVPRLLSASFSEVRSNIILLPHCTVSAFPQFNFIYILFPNQ